jgi:hypothetical protein
MPHMLSPFPDGNRPDQAAPPQAVQPGIPFLRRIIFHHLKSGKTRSRCGPGRGAYGLRRDSDAAHRGAGAEPIKSLGRWIVP